MIIDNSIQWNTETQ